MVRLWVIVFKLLVKKYFISIPLWFDCEKHPSLKSVVYMSFQFHYGSIVRYELDRIRRRVSKISIPLWFDCEMQNLKHIYVQLGHFNSTMVRLWEGMDYMWFRTKTKFQFHYGSIVSGNRLLGYLGICHFNSTMVRLWGYRRGCIRSIWVISIPLWFDCEFAWGFEACNQKTFQFHYGSIVSLSALRGVLSD